MMFFTFSKRWNLCASIILIPTSSFCAAVVAMRIIYPFAASGLHVVLHTDSGYVVGQVLFFASVGTDGRLSLCFDLGLQRGKPL